jgi:hypothetical protein
MAVGLGAVPAAYGREPRTRDMMLSESTSEEVITVASKNVVRMRAVRTDEVDVGLPFDVYVRVSDARDRRSVPRYMADESRHRREAAAAARRKPARKALAT